LYPPTVPLTKKQRNDLFTAVAQSGMNTTEFDLNPAGFENQRRVDVIQEAASKKGDSSWYAMIEHPSSESFLKIYRIRKIYRPDPEFFLHLKVGDEPDQKLISPGWPEMLGSIATWASEVKDYADTPDLWNDMRAQRELFAGPSMASLGNTPLTAAEQAVISAQLREIKNYVKENVSLTSKQFKQVQASFDEAEAASHRLGRKDWLLLFLGTTVTLYVTDLVSATAVQHITAMALQGVGHLFGIGGGPPAIAG
jgi:hypothetical protein